MQPGTGSRVAAHWKLLARSGLYWVLATWLLATPVWAEPEARLLNAEEEESWSDSADALPEEPPSDGPLSDETIDEPPGDASEQSEESETLIVEDVPPEVMSTPEPAAPRRLGRHERSGTGGADDSAPEEQPADETAPAGEPETPSETAAAAGEPESVAPGGLSIESAKFKGLQPGTSTIEDVDAALGQALSAEQDEPYEVRTYQVAPFKQVTLWLAEGQLNSIVVDLDRPFADQALIQQLGLEPVRSVPVVDDQGRRLGLAFPERGVLFNYAAQAPPGQVAQLILDSITAEPFLVRAETLRRERIQGGLDDLKVARRLEADAQRCDALEARLLLAGGRHIDALNLAERLVQQSPDELSYRLTLAQALVEAAEFSEAAKQLAHIVDSAAEDPLLVARAQLAWGQLLAAGPDRDYQEAIGHHLEAIKSAEPLKASPSPAQQLDALEVLFEAHLAVANDIAWGRWKSKKTVVPQWHDRAAEVAALLEKLTGNPRYQLTMARGQLAADVGMNGTLEPQGAVGPAEAAAEKLLAASDDPLVGETTQWELGLALYDAMQAELARQRLPRALDLGRAAIERLEPLLDARQATPGQAYLIGRLLFRIGSVYAVQMGDHTTAIGWFERAIPLLEQPIPMSALGDLGRQGETFVSMGVSFWETQRHEEALRLTGQGASLMEQAVREGTLEPTALAVPYGNLSSMHRHLGHDEEAKNYESLAAKSEEGSSG